MKIQLSVDELQRGGCNSKLSFDDLSYLLAHSRLNSAAQFDDAPQLQASPDLCTSIDTLSPFTSDPYLYGQVSAIHVLTDLHTVGAEPADCNVNLLLERAADLDVGAAILDGAADVLRAHKVRFAKGHSLRGPRTYLTLSATGRIRIPQQSLEMGPTYALVLTKALGAARVLFVDMLEHREVSSSAALQNLVTSHQQCLSTLQIARHGTTDVTGFGLAGAAYLLSGRGCKVSIDLSALPILSSPAMEVPASCDTRNNEVAFLDKMQLHATLTIPQHNALFGAQIAGPILAILPEEEAKAAVDALNAAGLGSATVIGRAVFGEAQSLVLSDHLT